jgi:putative membrane protein
MPTAIPYCGPGPGPAELLSRWNLDPWVMVGLAAAAGAYALRRRQGGEGRDLLVLGGLAVLALAFVSPLCALSSALFSARVFHHALLIAVAAPLLAFGLPRVPAPSLAAATLAQTVALWAWHAPAAYDWALSNDGAYWLMQASLLGSGLAFWAAARRASELGAAAALLSTLMQTGLLGALITFAGRPLYAPHLTTTEAWGLTPLADQQLGGLIMWAPMAGAYLIGAVLMFGQALASEPKRAPAL